MDTPKGKIVASCGHELSDAHSGEVVIMKDRDGPDRAYTSGYYCPYCAAKSKLSRDYVPSFQAADAWLKGEEA